jgi:hypothetical protein
MIKDIYRDLKEDLKLITRQLCSKCQSNYRKRG